MSDRKRSDLKERAYDLHGLLKVHLVADGKSVLDFFDAELGLFASEATSEPDLEVRVGDFDFPSSTRTRLLGDSRATEDGTIFGRSRHKVARWRFAIRGLDQRCTVLWFSGGPFSIGFLQHRYMEPLIAYKLAQKGFALVHGACVSNGGRAALFPGLMHSGKTSIAMYLVSEGWRFQSDDRTLLDSRGRAYCFPRRLHLSPSLQELWPGVMSEIGLGRRLSMAAKAVVHRLTAGYGSLSEAIDIRDVIPSAAVADSSTLNQVILLTPYSSTKLYGPLPISNSAAASRVLAMDVRDSSHLCALLLDRWCLDADATATFWMDREREVLERAFQDVDCYELLMPRYAPSLPRLLREVAHLVAGIGSPASSVGEHPTELLRHPGIR